MIIYSTFLICFKIILASQILGLEISTRRISKGEIEQQTQKDNELIFKNDKIIEIVVGKKEATQNQKQHI